MPSVSLRCMAFTLRSSDDTKNMAIRAMRVYFIVFFMALLFCVVL